MRLRIPRVHGCHSSGPTRPTSNQEACPKEAPNGHGSKARTPNEHPNPHYLPQNSTIGLNPQPNGCLGSRFSLRGRRKRSSRAKTESCPTERLDGYTFLQGLLAFDSFGSWNLAVGDWRCGALLGKLGQVVIASFRPAGEGLVPLRKG